MMIRFYEITAEEADQTIGEVKLKEVFAAEEKEKELIEEAEQWELIKDVEGYEELYWHDNDIIDHSYVAVIDHYYGSGMILKDGHFYGAFVNTKDTSSMGLSVTRWEDTGLVCIDGFRAGKTTEWETHSSDEVYWEHKAKYCLQKKEEKA